MIILDLFCGGGGAGKGYAQAFPGAVIIGVDIKPQPLYPFAFMQADAMEVLEALKTEGTYKGITPDLVHASPPCQAYSVLTPDQTIHPDLLTEILQICEELPYPTVVENVENAAYGRRRPASNFVMLCGSHFNITVEYEGMTLALRRHRAFWTTGFGVEQPKCKHVHPCIDVTGTQSKMPMAWRRANPERLSGAPHTLSQRIMGIDWLKGSVLSEAIPPIYTEYIAKHLIVRRALELLGGQRNGKGQRLA